MVYYHCAPRVIIYPGKPGPKPGGMKKTGLDGDDTYAAETSAPATIVVRTPADATLTSTNNGDVSFNQQLDGGFNLTVNTGGGATSSVSSAAARRWRA